MHSLVHVGSYCWSGTLLIQTQACCNAPAKGTHWYTNQFIISMLMLTAKSVCTDSMLTLFSAFSWNVPVIWLSRSQSSEVALVVLHSFIQCLWISCTCNDSNAAACPQLCCPYALLRLTCVVEQIFSQVAPWADTSCQHIDMSDLKEISRLTSMSLPVIKPARTYRQLDMPSLTSWQQRC